MYLTYICILCVSAFIILRFETVDLVRPPCPTEVGTPIVIYLSDLPSLISIDLADKAVLHPDR